MKSVIIETTVFASFIVFIGWLFASLSSVIA